MKKTDLAVALVARRGLPVSSVASTLGVSRSYLSERLKREATPRTRYRKTDDLELLPAIRRLVDERPTYGYRRIGALLNRQRAMQGLPRLNHKHIYRLMSQNGLLLQRGQQGHGAGNRDEAVVRELMQRYQSKGRFRVLTAANGEEGLRLARAHHPDAITLDVMMPGLDGWAVLSQLTGDPQLSDIPVIMLTVVQDKKKGYALGAAEYLTKPIDRGRLFGVLSKYRRDEPVLVVDDNLLIKAQRWFMALTADTDASITKIARAHKVSPSYVTRVIYLAFLAPDIVRRIAAGEQAPELTADRLLARVPLTPDWAEQIAQLRSAVIP